MAQTSNSWNQFSDIIPQELISSLQQNGFSKPTPIQTLTLSNYTHTNNFIIASQTGTGKTLCFSIPIITEILKSNQQVQQFCQALIITPTRELAMQIEQQIKLISKPFYPQIQCCSIVGGFSSQKQERLLSKNPSIIISTPGRLWELIESQPELFHNFSSLSMICLDEADRMIQLGHFKELGKILQFIMKNQGAEKVSSEERTAIEQFLQATSGNDDEIQQILPSEEQVSKKKKKWNKVFLVSATFGSWFGDEKVRQTRKKNKKKAQKQEKGDIQSKKLQFLMKQLKLSRPPTVLIGNQESNEQQQQEQQILPENIVVNTVYCPINSKLENIVEIIKREAESGGIIIFCSRISSCRKLSDAFNILRIKNINLHSKLQQRVRISRWEKFLSQECKLLVCTDLGARGLDVPLGLVKTVVHWELPINVETFIHRSGRTGRMGTAGNAYVLIEGLEQKKKWKYLESRAHVTSCKIVNSVENLEIQSIWDKVQQNQKTQSVAREKHCIKSKAQMLGVEMIENQDNQQSSHLPVSCQSKKIQKQKVKSRNIYMNQEEIEKYNKILSEQKETTRKQNSNKQQNPEQSQKKIEKRLKKQRQMLIKKMMR